VAKKYKKIKLGICTEATLEKKKIASEKKIIRIRAKINLLSNRTSILAQRPC